MCPQRRTFHCAVTECLGRGTQRCIGVQHRIGQSLEQLCFVSPDSKVMELDLRLRPGQRQGTFKHSRVAVLVGQTPTPDRGSGRRWSKTRCVRSRRGALGPCGASSSLDRARTRRYSRAAAHRSSRQQYGHGARVRETGRDPFHIAVHPRCRLRRPPPGQPTPSLPHPIACGAWRAARRSPARILFEQTDSQRPDGPHPRLVEPGTARRRR